jgi:CheY-like chemotaxis protein
MQRWLGRLGCSWETAVDGRAAIDALRRSGDFDVVLMDLHMPVVDGIEATRRIRAGEAGEAVRNIWIAAVTADNEPAQQRRAEEAGINDFVSKPVGQSEVRGLLLQFLEARRRESARAR